jgi:signal transduction histidine kinase
MEHFVLALGGTLCALQMALIGALLVERGKRRSATLALEQSEARSRGLLDALREVDRRKDLFLAMLAHELRNPLNSIRMATELMGMEPNDPARIASARDVIARQTNQLTHLVDDLLDVSSIRQDKLPFRFEPLDLVGIVSQAAEAAKPILAESKIRFSIDLCARPVRVRCDAVRMAQVISNLLSNAAKFTQKHGEVGLSMARAEGGVVIRVADNGVGIPESMLGRIFDLFTQVDGSRSGSKGGLGIGLTLVKRIVEVHGGSIEVESAGVGRGACFTLHLPLLADQVDSPAEFVVARVGSSSFPSA